MKKNITKINDYVYSNMQNVWVVLNYTGNFLVNEEDVSNFMNWLRINRMSFSIDILKFHDTKKYYIEVYNGLSGYTNNEVSQNLYKEQAKFLFTNKIKDLLDNRILALGWAELEKNFVLFNNSILEQKFKNMFVDDVSKNRNDIVKLETTVFMNYYKQFLEELGSKKEWFDQWYLKEVIQNIGKGGWTGMESGNIITDSFVWEELHSFVISNEFIMSYFLLWNDRIYKNERSGDIDLIKFLNFLDSKISYDKYFVKFNFTYDDSTISHNNQTDFKIKGDSSFYKFPTNLWKTWKLNTSLFLFGETPDLGDVSRKLVKEFQDLEIANPDEAYSCSPFYIQDNAYLWSNYIMESNIADFFKVLRKYEFNDKGIVLWREMFSNIILKLYPHLKAGINNLWKLEQWAHAAVVWTTGSGKSEYSLNVWKQLWKDWTRWIYIDNIGWLDRRVAKNFPWADVSIYKFWMDYINAKKNELSFYFWLDSKINDFNLKKQENENKIKEEKLNDGWDKELLKEWEDEIDDINRKIKYLSDNSTELNKLIYWYVSNKYKNNDRIIDVNDFLTMYSNGIKTLDIPEKIKDYILNEIKINNTSEVKTIIAKDYQEVNIIWKKGTLNSIWENETDAKVELLSTLLNIESLDNDELKTIIKTIFGWYINWMEYWEMFNYNNFKDYIFKVVEWNEIGLGKSDIYTIKEKVSSLSEQYVNILNSNKDFLEYIKEQNLLILDISALSNENSVNKNLLFIFFTILWFFLKYDSIMNSASPVITYLFIEEFHNYLQEIDIQSKKLKRVVWKMIKEVRNYWTIIYLISQLYKDFLDSWVLWNISQYVIFDMKNVQAFQEQQKDSQVYKQYMEDYITVYRNDWFEIQTKGGWEFNTKKDYRLWFYFNTIKQDECFIMKVRLSDFK